MIGTSHSFMEDTQTTGSVTDIILSSLAFTKNLNFGAIVSIIFFNLLTLCLALLANYAMMVAIIRSTIFHEKLETSIFSKLFDKTVLKVFFANILIASVFIFLIGVFFAVNLYLILNTPNLIVTGIMTLFFIPMLIYLSLRLALIPIGVAADDIPKISEALPKTKGHLWSVFKILISTNLILLLCLLVQRLPLLLASEANNITSIIIFLFSAAFFLILVPLSQLVEISLSYGYKKIRVGNDKSQHS